MGPANSRPKFRSISSKNDSQNDMKAAVILTCFNRKNKTLACVESIYRQRKVDDLKLTIFLVDDGSTDGTREAVARQFPHVTLLTGDGTLYWCGGMNLAWRTAVNQGFDYYIWVNDDVIMDGDAFYTMFKTFEEALLFGRGNPVIVGCFKEPGTGQHSYGGFSVVRSFWGIRTKRKIPTGDIEICDSFNGNLVLIPHSVVEKIGLLDDQFRHGFGDKDYGYRCLRHDVPMYITPSYIGECSRNGIAGTWMDPEVPLKERWRRLYLPNGLPPSEYFYSHRKNSNVVAGGIAIIKLYLRLIFPRMWTRLSQNESGE